MWKKTEDEIPLAPPQPAHAQRPPSPPPQARRETAAIGPSLEIRGNLSGQEDLLVLGRLEGKIELREHAVTVGSTGRVKGDIYALTIQIEGEVLGNLYGDKEVVVKDSGRVQGNIVAPRVSLENGAKFKGSIDMEPERAAKPAVTALAVAAEGGKAPAAEERKPVEAPLRVNPAPSRA